MFLVSKFGRGGGPWGVSGGVVELGSKRVLRCGSTALPTTVLGVLIVNAEATVRD